MLEILLILLSVNLLQFSSATNERITHIMDKVYLCENSVARDEEYVRDQGFARIFNFGEGPGYRYKIPLWRYTHIGLKNDGSGLFIPKAEVIAGIIIGEGDKALVHDETEGTIAPIFAMYYLIREKKWAYEKAYKYVQSKRSCPNLNIKYLNQLKEFEKWYLKEK